MQSWHNWRSMALYQSISLCYANYMKHQRWPLLLGLCLVLISGLFYLLQINIFHDTKSTFFYMLQDLAFVPIQVLLVTLILNQWMVRKAKEDIRTKMNMVIGAFYSEMGLTLLKKFQLFDAQCELLQPIMQIELKWNAADFLRAKQRLLQHHFAIACNSDELTLMKTYLIEKRSILLLLLENPNLLEHESFTDLLWALSHFSEELAVRETLSNLPQADYLHLAGDLQRAYVLMLSEWLSYIQHLRDDYPYIFSLIVRTNPFNENASPIIHG